MRLILPTEEYEQQWLDMIREMEAINDEIVPYALFFHQYNFQIFLEKTRDFRQGINLVDFVPATTYFLVEDKESRLIGAVNIRHKLNEGLLFSRGHIGYGIRPSEQRKGYAAEMLRLCLEKCREMGLAKVLVTCNKNNIASAKTILKNMGVLENEVIDDKGIIVQRYWINLVH